VTDPDPSQPINTNATRWIPFALESVSQFRTGPPPALTSNRYALDFDEVRRLGGAGPNRRSRDQETIARWHTEPALPQVNRIARTEAASDGRDLLDHARLFAVINLTVADAMASAFDATYTYRAWRPVTAIRDADTDGNPQTQPDLVWSPLLATPLYPEYPSPRAAILAAGARVLTAYFGRRYSFSTTSSAVPDLTRFYRDFDAFADEGARAGILAGSHFRAAVEQGAQAGAEVARWVLEQCLRPVGKARTAVNRCRCRTGVAEGATPLPASSHASPSRATHEAPRPSLSR
jgi:hypothetical protein